MALNIEDVKSKVSVIAHDIGTLAPYNEDEMPDDWDELADYLAEQARVLASLVSSLASYAGLARRKANAS